MLVKNNVCSVLFDGFRLHVQHKQYDTDVGDHMPMMLANGSSIGLTIIYEIREGLFKVETVQLNNDCTPLFLHKRTDQYNSIIPISLEPL